MKTGWETYFEIHEGKYFCLCGGGGGGSSVFRKSFLCGGMYVCMYVFFFLIWLTRSSTKFAV